MSDTIYHIPALLNETLEGLAVKSAGTYVDMTFGGGGHSRAIMERLSEGGRLLSFDQDTDAFDNAMQQQYWQDAAESGRWQFVHGNFRYLKNFLRYYNAIPVDGILADLGVSFHHFDTSERGFSFRLSGPLDMRMNRQATLSAADVVNTYSEERLADIIYLYGECRNARQIAKAVVKSRSHATIERTEQLCDLLTPLCGRDKEKKDLARVFQALRIEVNDEMSALKEMLTASLDVLCSGGRIAVLTYHSLEDRMVKNFFKTGNLEGRLEKDFYGNPVTPFLQVNSKVITASAEEVENNPRSRSAKLRIAEKKG